MGSRDGTTTGKDTSIVLIRGEKGFHMGLRWGVRATITVQADCDQKGSSMRAREEEDMDLPQGPVAGLLLFCTRFAGDKRESWSRRAWQFHGVVGNSPNNSS